MGAYSVPIEKYRCCELGCRAWAKEVVFNHMNAPLGRFCKRHAAQRVARHNKELQKQGTHAKGGDEENP